LIKPIYQTENQYSKGRKPNPEFNFPRAKGEYIALCEGDDYWTDPLKLQKQVPFLEGNLEYSMCCHSVKTIFEDNWKGQKKERFKSPIDNATFLEILDNHFIPTNSLVFRNIIKEWPAWLSSPNMISGDIPLEHMLAYHGKLKYIYENMAVKRINAGGVTADPQHENLKYKFKAEFYYYINIYTKYHYIDALFKKILGSNKAMIKKSIKNGNLKETTCCIFRIISTVYIRYMKIYY
jgi:glycosyltransferase involved in cell wall biosynthesis